MSNSIAILAKDIRTLDGLYSLNDLHKASGSNKNHQPAFFIRNAQTQELIKEIDRSANSQTAYKTIRGGLKQGTYVCEDLVYAYAMWISAKFSLIVIRAFKAMQKPIPQITVEKISDEQRGELFHIVAERTGKNGTLRAKMWGKLKTHFRYSSYHDLLAIHFEEAKHLLETMDIGEEKLAISNDITDKQVLLILHHAKYLCEAVQTIIKPLSDLHVPIVGSLRGHADELMMRVRLVEKKMIA